MKQFIRKLPARKLLSLFLVAVMLSALAAGIPFPVSAATDDGFTITASSTSAGLGTVTYTGKSYKTGATGQSLTYDLNAGFLLVNPNDDENIPIWGVCAYSGAADPPVDTAMGALIPLTATGTYVDGLNNTGGGSHGSHYIVNGPSNDSSWGYGRNISTDFIFRCFYYANQLYGTEKLPTAISEDNCSLQEAIAIAYRYEWDVRLIQYGNTGTWNNTTGTWTVNNVDNWTKSTTHFGGVTDGNATHQAIVTAADQILVAAMNDADGISGNIQTGTLGSETYLYYTLSNGKTCELYCLSGPARGTGEADYQDLFAYKPATVEEYTGTIQITKVNESGEALSRVYFGLYSDAACTNELKRTITVNGAATFTVEPGTYYVKELKTLDGYVPDETVYKAVVIPYQITTISNSSDGKFVNYQPTGSWAPAVTKTYQGGTLTDGQFTFELRSGTSGGTLLQTVTNNADGSIPFTAIPYTADDIGKTYTYVVLESSASVTGSYTKDSHTVTYTVKISYGGTGGKLTVTESVSGSTTFVNKSWNSQYGAIAIKKVDENGSPLAGVEFDVYNVWLDGSNYDLYDTVTTDASGVAIYGKKADGTMMLIPGGTYFLQEKSAPDGYLLDETRYYITVVGGEITYANGGDPVVNYPATVTWTPVATKQLIGREAKTDEFAVELRDGDGNLLGTYWNEYSADTFWFPWITYTYEDVGTHTYTIREVTGSDPTVAYDTHTLIYTVTVSLKDGALTVTEEHTGSTEFVNYVLTGSFTPTVTKVFQGGTLTNGQFFFELSENGKVLWTVTNNADGSIPFAAIPYTADDIGKTYTYTVREISGSDPTVAYDTHTLTYTVTVSYEGTGSALTVTETHTGSTVFVNCVPTGSFTPTAAKQLVGRELTDGEFTFELSENGEVLQTVTNNADGSVTFDPIPYTLENVGTHTYTVREVPGSDPTVAYTTYNVTYTVTVAYVGSETLLVTETHANQETFTNFVPTGSFTPGVTKVFQGGTLADGQFTFELTDGNGTVLQTVANRADGSIPFTAITYTLADVGTHTYTVREVPGSDPTVAYDSHTVTFTVTVSYLGLAELEIAKSVSGNTVFTNTASVSIEVYKVDPNGNALAGAIFLLEWSKDGTEWQHVFYSAAVTEGSCSNAEITDGALTVGSNGRIVFDGLCPGLHYRLTETKAPEGMQLLAGSAYEGVPETDVSLRVVNQPVFTMPQTGGKGFWSVALAGTLLCVSVGLLLGGGSFRKKKQK